MSFNFAPKGWAQCNGQLLPINQNQALFSLLGTTYGGNGQTNFALPDLRSRVPISEGNGHTLGERAGEESHTLSLNELPDHEHIFQSNVSGTKVASPSGAVFTAAANLYSPPPANTTLVPGTSGLIGGSQAHQNMQPFLTINFCIALVGIFPSQN